MSRGHKVDSGKSLVQLLTVWQASEVDQILGQLIFERLQVWRFQFPWVPVPVFNSFCGNIFCLIRSFLV